MDRGERSMSRYPSKTGNRSHAATTTTRREVGKIGAWSVRRDEDLLAEYVKNETQEAFEELVRRYESEICHHLHKYLRNAELAEDAFQATFLQVHLKCRQFDPCRRFRPWLYKIATNRAIDLLRRNRRWNAVSLNAGTPERGSSKGLADHDMLSVRNAAPSLQLEAAEDRQRIRSVVDKFPTRLKGVLDLVMFQGLKYQEAADTLGIPLGSVKSRMHEAVVRLRRTFTAPARVDSRDNPGSCRGAVQGVGS
jgi:RNA polymerase sigma-70 factor, ECF subfamily